MTNQDPRKQGRGGEPERVVVRDRRRIDPETGQARVVGGDKPSPSPRAPGPAASRPPAAPSSPNGGDTESNDTASLAELDERTADLQRITAEYANYRRRVERDRQAVVIAAKAQFVGELLTVLDDLDRAEAHGDLSGAFKLVAEKLVGVLTKLGLESFGGDGEPFDPAVHEAVQHASSAEVSGPTVSAVLRRGYRLGDRVLRPAMVAVADRPSDGAPGTPTDSSLDSEVEPEASAELEGELEDDIEPKAESKSSESSG